MISFDLNPILKLSWKSAHYTIAIAKKKNAMVHKGDLVSSVLLIYPSIIGQYNLWSWKWPTIELHTLLDRPCCGHF